MICLASFGATVVQLKVGEKDTVLFTADGSFRCPPVSIGPGKLYFTTVLRPNAVQLQADGSPNATTVAELEHPILSLASFNNKLYCLCRGVLISIDPLSTELEQFALTFPAASCDGMDKRLFIVGESGDEGAVFCFVDGIKPVQLPKGSQYLGFYKRRVLLRGNGGVVVAVGDEGVVTPFVDFPIHGKRTAFANGHLIDFDATRRCLLVDGKVQPGAPHLPQDALVTLSGLSQAEPSDSCIICYCDLSEDESVTLDCGHSFHTSCLLECTSRAEAYAEKGDHIVFQMAKCPGGCGTLVRHRIAPRSKEITKLSRTIAKAAQMELRFQAPTKTAEDLLFYLCHRCKKPFFGGLKICPRMNPTEAKKDPTELTCIDCAHSCKEHAHDFALFKCHYCCNIATHRSFGNRFSCDRCEAAWDKAEPAQMPCRGASCPFQQRHPSPGASVCLLCIGPSKLRLDQIEVAVCPGQPVAS